MPKINAAGFALLTSFEGCELHAYQDVGDVWTIGYGHTGGVTPGETITQAQADALLAGDLATFEQGVSDRVSHDITPNQFSALVCLTYNVGLDGCPVMFSLVNAGEYALAQHHFGAYVYDDGAIVEGLVRRRAAEAALFGTP